MAESRTNAAVRLPGHAPLTALRGVGPVLAARLRAAGIADLAALVTWFPRRLRALRRIESPAEAEPGAWVRVDGRVTGARRSYLPGRRVRVVVSFAAGDGTPFDVVFFNQPFRAAAYTVGEQRTVEGVLERSGRRFAVGRAVVLPRGARPTVPFQLGYPAVDGVSDQRLAALIGQALDLLDADAWPPPHLPAGLLLDAPLPPAGAALRAMHSPRDLREYEGARLRFALAEAAALFRGIEAAARARRAAASAAVVDDPALSACIAEVVPFSWTEDQQRAVARIDRALRGSSPMGLLLQGDVGTGKTAVAVYAAVAVLRAGAQVAFLAPTELLAEQIAAVLREWLAPIGVEPELLTASRPGAAARAVRTALAVGRAPLVVGTHALLSAATEFERLGLVVIDEQHRFGVDQRQALVGKGRAPHILTMSATPIPRTLALALYGDLDQVVLRQRPCGRRPAPALFVTRRHWPRVVRAVRRRARRGQQCYVVCAQIGLDGEKGGAVCLHRELSAVARCGLVHGRLSMDERRATTAAFRRGELDVLVGTTVLEVGLDVASATLMVVIGAESFGIATLHQLRGRVGRGRRRGLCVLTGEPTERTRAVCATTDGFALAESDLRLRGAGELSGLRQSGAGELRVLDPVEDFELLARVRAAVRAEASG